MKRLLTAAAAILVLALAGCSSPPDTADDALLDEHGLAGLSGQQIVDRLEALGGADRPADLKASVRPDELQLSDADGRETAVPLPDDLFYLAVAPYLESTHDCFYHSLTTCQGELAEQDVHLRIVADDGTVLVDEQTTTHANGFVATWVPRGSSGTVEITDGDHAGSYAFTTDDEAPTCVTSVRLT